MESQPANRTVRRPTFGRQSNRQLLAHARERKCWRCVCGWWSECNASWGRWIGVWNHKKRTAEKTEPNCRQQSAELIYSHFRSHVMEQAKNCLAMTGGCSYSCMVVLLFTGSLARTTYLDWVAFVTSACQFVTAFFADCLLVFLRFLFLSSAIDQLGAVYFISTAILLYERLFYSTAGNLYENAVESRMEKFLTSGWRKSYSSWVCFCW